MKRATHITVNLLLIVVLTIQPGLAFVLQQGCSAGITTGFACAGCGCCKVESEAEMCPCCSGEPLDQQRGCCGQSEQGDDRVASSDDDPFADIVFEEGATPECSDPELRMLEDASQPCCVDEPLFVAESVAKLFAACHCKAAPAPAETPAPCLPAPEQRDVLTVSIAYSGSATLVERPLLAPVLDFARHPISPHFSQIAFCVWRL